METLAPAGAARTHAVTNQPPPLVGYNVLAASRVLRERLADFGADWALRDLHALGTLAGSEEAIGWGVAANTHPPELRAFDRFGHRIDEVTYHPAYHALMRVAVGRGLHASTWRDPQPGVEVVGKGHGLPVTAA